MSTKLLQVKALLQGIRDDDALYVELRALLEQQRLGMIRRDAEGLQTINEEIQQRYERLSEGTQYRRSLLEQLGVSANRAGIEQVLSWLPAAQKSAAQRWWALLERKVENCKAYNEKNGELLIRQYEFIQSFLGTGPDFIYQR